MSTVTLLQGLVLPDFGKLQFQIQNQNSPTKREMLCFFKGRLGSSKKSYKFGAFICFTQNQSYMSDLSTLKGLGHHRQQIGTDVLIEYRQMTKLFYQSNLDFPYRWLTMIKAYAIQRCCDYIQIHNGKQQFLFQLMQYHEYAILDDVGFINCQRGVYKPNYFFEYYNLFSQKK
ncbi:hypothetical protein pb186bvf_020973 [Paramecium bursaria]